MQHNSFNSFGDWLKRRRKTLDLTQEELASQVGCSAAAIRKFEAEERRPSAQIVDRLAEIFNIPLNEQPGFLRFARGDWKAAPPETSQELPWHVSSKSQRSNIPATATSLVGREHEITLVREYLSKEDIRLVTLIGPPGIGKTRLSIESARAALPDFPDGAFFVALDPLDDPSLIAQTIAHSLGYVGATNISTNEQLKEGIGDKHLLLVLDNCEHLIEDAASLASGLLSACPLLKIISTSRESLRIPGEWLYPVPAFDLPEESSSLDMESASQYPALTLFAERARAVRPDFALTADNIQAVASICAHLDGLPLVIELIAARMRWMSPQALLERLSGQFVLTADGMRAASERQKTLNNAIRWSYNLLSTEEQKLFTYFSVFSGAFTLEMAEKIFSRAVAEKSISSLMASLLDKSLLQLVSGDKGETRYTMLVTIQEFAQERLREAGEEIEIRDRHLAYFLDLSQNADRELRGPDQIAWLHRLGAMVDNLRTALDWAIESRQTDKALQLVRKLDWFWFVRSDHNEGRQWLRRVLEMPDTDLYPEAQAEVLTQLAHHTWLQIGGGEARPVVDKALSIARAHADKHNIARALSILGLILGDEGSFAAAQSALEESKMFYREVRDEWGYAHAALCLGQVYHNQGDQATALSLREQVLLLFRKLGDRYFECATLSYIGMVRIRLGNLTHGVVALRESLILAQQLDSKYEIAMILRYFARAAQAEGKHSRAVYLFWAAKDIYDSIGAFHELKKLNLEKEMGPSRAVLTEAAFAEAVEQGRLMTMEQAIQYALEADTT